MQIYSAKESPPSEGEREFPMAIRHKSGTVTIYSTPNRRKNSYTISYHSEGVRCRQTRREFVKAFRHAQEVANKIGDGALNVLALDGRERFVYQRATELAAKTGLELDVLVARAVEASTILGNTEHLVDAARLYNSHHGGIVRKLVPEVVSEPIENRRNSGRSVLYVRDLRVRLEQRFAAAFKVPITSVTTADIENFLAALKGGPRTKLNFLTAIGTLLSFAKNREYLAETHPGISKVEFNAEVVNEIEIFSANEMATYLSAAKAELVPALVIGALERLRPQARKIPTSLAFTFLCGFPMWCKTARLIRRGNRASRMRRHHRCRNHCPSGQNPAWNFRRGFRRIVATRPATRRRVFLFPGHPETLLDLPHTGPAAYLQCRIQTHP